MTILSSTITVSSSFYSLSVSFSRKALSAFLPAFGTYLEGSFPFSADAFLLGKRAAHKKNSRVTHQALVLQKLCQFLSGHAVVQRDGHILAGRAGDRFLGYHLIAEGIGLFPQEYQKEHQRHQSKDLQYGKKSRIPVCFFMGSLLPFDDILEISDIKINGSTRLRLIRFA